MNSARDLSFVAAIVMWLIAGASGIPTAARQAGTASPGPQWGHSLVYDERLERIVLLGAAMRDTAEIWTWDGRRWEQIDQPGLPRRSLAGAAYDAKRQRLVVFGGRVGREGFTKGDTWEWDGTTWREASDTSAGIRNHHSMAFDEGRGRTVMYGGTVPPPDISAQEQLKQRDKWRWPTDTWEWDGARWHRMPVQGPGSRSGPTLEYDAARRNVVLFGGVGADGVYGTGTWTWNGEVWRQTASDGPSLRASHQMAYDTSAGVVFLYGGGNQSGRLQDMWRWDGTTWTEVAMTGPTPGPRNGHAMAYDRARRRIVLHGGFGSGAAPLADTWEWDGTQWTEIK